MESAENTYIDKSSPHYVVQDVDLASSGSSESEGFGLSVKRRGFIGLASATAAVMVTGMNRVQAGFFYSTRPVAGIPDAWVREKGVDVLRYANYIKDLKLKNVTPRMVLAPHFKKRGVVSNSLPPRRLWKRIGATLKVIDRLAWELKKPVREILSVYRSPNYNRACRGRSRSQHMENRAVDVKFHGASSYAAARKVREIRKRGHFRGGVGCYSSFIHIDTRGENADW